MIGSSTNGPIVAQVRLLEAVELWRGMTLRIKGKTYYKRLIAKSPKTKNKQPTILRTLNQTLKYTTLLNNGLKRNKHKKQS